MKKLAKTSAVITLTVLAAGCASTSDLDKLSARVDSLENKISSVSTDAMKAREAADAASSRATAAEAAANRAANYAQETNSKLDNMFRKSMMK